MNSFKMYRFFILFIALSLSVSGTFAQDILKGKDLSQVKIDQLTPTELSNLKTQISAAGMTPDQVEQMAISKGMPASEANKLKIKLLSTGEVATSLTNGAVQPSNEKKSALKENNSSDYLDNYKTSKTLINPLIFGSELYSGVAPSFEPNFKIATPLNYILGPDDHIQVSVYGVQEYNGDLLVSSEGFISIPNVGQIKVAGMTIESATEKIKSVMGNGVYSYLKSGGSKISVTLSKIRSIKVTIIGSNRPGSFSISSLATVFNALYIAGGPGLFGSFREIELIRNNKVERKIDLYKFLLFGDQKDNLGLKDNDVIRIPPYKNRVQIDGEVKRPGIFEILPNENFSNLLEFASGFTDSAYTASVLIFQRSEKERTLHDLSAKDFKMYLPKIGDRIIVSKILDRFTNRVKIAGAIFRPGVYELSSELKVADLLRKADGLKEDAFTDRAQIIRLKEDLTKQIISFDIKSALSGDPLNNIVLAREDSIYISSVNDLQDKFKVRIQGEIRNPGSYDFIDKLTLKDLILQAGGFTDAAYKSIEISRLIKKDKLDPADNSSTELITTNINVGDLSEKTGAIPLKAMDVVTIRRIAGYQIPESVSVLGQVQFPGPYSLSIRNERVSDLIKRAGGFSPEAYPEGAFIKRYKTISEKELSAEAASKLEKNTKDSSNFVSKEILREFDKLPLDIKSILEKPGSINDFVLKNFDEITIPKFESQVKISGEVLLSTQVAYETGKNLRSYISAAGGFTTSALRSKIYIVYTNGKVASTSKFLFFKSYPKVEPGAEVVVPRKKEKKGTSIAEVVGITSALASIATVLVLLKK